MLGPAGRALPVWPEVQEELRGKGVTSQLLWEEYRSEHAEGYAYSRFCDLYREWRGRQDLVMRQDHKGGERGVCRLRRADGAGGGSGSGAVREAQVFVAVMGASSYSYAEATWTQTVEDGVGSHARAFTFFGGRRSWR